MRRPFLKWFPDNWRGDPALRLCSLAARGLWHELCLIASNCEPCGELRPGGAIPTLEEIAVLVSAPPPEVAAGLAELERRGVFSRCADGAIYSRKMVRDEARRLKAVEDGKRGGNPKLTHKPRRTKEDNGTDKGAHKGKDKATHKLARTCATARGLLASGSDSSPDSDPSPGEEHSLCPPAADVTRSAPPDPEQDPDLGTHREFLGWFAWRYESKTGKPYPADGPRDGRLVRELREIAGGRIEDLQYAADRMLESEHFGKSLSVLRNHFPALLAAKPNAAGKGTVTIDPARYAAELREYDAEVARRRREEDAKRAALAANPPPSLSAMLEGELAKRTGEKSQAVSA